MMRIGYITTENLLEEVKIVVAEEAPSWVSITQSRTSWEEAVRMWFRVASPTSAPSSLPNSLK